jgi:Tol biopolymer transport system component
VTERYPTWSPDGKSIAYTADIHGIYQVFTKALGAPDAAQLTHAASNCSALFWSPDGGTIYYASRGDLWSIGASGGTPEVVMEKATSVALHPDGKTVVFDRDGKNWVGTLKGGTPKELPMPQIPDAAPLAFSPDGASLAVASGRNETWVLPWPSGTPRSLGTGSAARGGVAWLPDSRHLVTVETTDPHSLLLVDTADGSSRVICRGTDDFLYPSVSPDGKKIAYSGGATEWDVLEISLPEGRNHTLVGGGGTAWWPEWAPSGTHFLFSHTIGSNMFIEDRSAAEGFSKRVVDPPEGSNYFQAVNPRWASDGTRFLFFQYTSVPQLALANASGGQWTRLADTTSRAHAWSPDGQWIAFLRTEDGKQQLVKMKPLAGATTVPLKSAAPVFPSYGMLQWSPSGEWIAYVSADGISMISPDGNTIRKLTARQLLAYAFTKDGAQVYGIVRNTQGEGAQWQLYSIDVKTGADKMIAPLDLPASTDSIAGFSLHPDGNRFLTSIAKWPFDIWMLEGWDQPPQKTWLDRLLRR